MERARRVMTASPEKGLMLAEKSYPTAAILSEGHGLRFSFRTGSRSPWKGGASAPKELDSQGDKALFRHRRPVVLYNISLSGFRSSTVLHELLACQNSLPS